MMCRILLLNEAIASEDVYLDESKILQARHGQPNYYVLAFYPLVLMNAAIILEVSMSICSVKRWPFYIHNRDIDMGTRKVGTSSTT
jgi:hypothetical protein